MTDAEAESPQSAVEEAVHAACLAGNYDRATTLLVDAYGPELYSFLLAQFQGQFGPADDVFSQFNEDLWRGLPQFEWRCSARAWAYRLARNAAHRHRKLVHNRAARRVALEDIDADLPPGTARTQTRPYIRTEVKEAFRAIREQLSLDDQDLLTLRVDRRMSWREIAFAMSGTDAGLDAPEQARLEVSLRQRFTELRRRLKRLALEHGLLPS